MSTTKKGSINMGYGTFKSSDWDSYTTSKHITRDSSSSDIYKSSKVKDEFNPKNIKIRESCESTDHPDPTSII